MKKNRTMLKSAWMDMDEERREAEAWQRQLNRLYRQPALWGWLLAMIVVCLVIIYITTR
jgi:hypothetical protein